MTPGAAVLLAATALAASAASAQDLQTRVRDAGDDRVVFGFPARPGVCGAGDAIVIREADGSTMLLSGRGSRGDWRSWRSGESPCEVGGVVVAATRSGATLTNVRVRVGRPDASSGGALVGTAAGQEAADYLLAVAGHAAAPDARDLILAAALAGDAVRWPGLVRLAKDRALPAATRKAALHWLGREAAAEAARELGGIVRDRTEEDEVREAAVFALSRLPRDQAVTLLIEVVRTVPEARIRSRALFWLADLDDPRAIALFEEILTRG
ncbi:MAG TPA: HEAT repeat domain-containing protein [Longimicrobiales bacterium]|nr:HEAT repeat domain-containing protein [Longimicrobiales bacterium]